MKTLPPQTESRLGLQRWPYRSPFVISRAVLHEQFMAYAQVNFNEHLLQGEGELHESDLGRAQAVLNEAKRRWAQWSDWPTREQLRESFPADGARNALDALLWDVECKRTGLRAWELAGLDGLDESSSVQTMVTITLGTPDAMASVAQGYASAPTLKLKLGDAGKPGLDRDIERCFAVAAAAPGALLTVDPNEAWTPDGLRRFAQAVRSLPLALIEQPLPAGQEDLYPELRVPVPIAADEACTTLDSLDRLAGKVQVVNLKLDKCGGLTEALLMCERARELGLQLMVGCNCGTSLAMAPAFLVAVQCRFVDLDGPMFMQGDRPHPVCYHQHRMSAPSAALWG